MQRLLRYHQHPVLSVFPHVLVHVLRGHRHAAAARQQLHLTNAPSPLLTVIVFPKQAKQNSSIKCLTVRQ